MDATTEQLRTLVAVLDHGTFDRAAAALHITSSAVSQRIKALEQQTGRVLLLRTKPARPTTSGSVVVRLARQVALLESEAMDELGLEGAGARPRIPLVINADSLATWVLPALAGVERASFEITIDDQDHSIERLRDGTAMAAITSDSEPVQGCTVRPLGVMRYRAVASRTFVEQWLPSGFGDDALSEAPVVVFDRKDALQDRYLEGRLEPGAKYPPRHYVPASSDFMRAIELGLGWGMLPDLQARPLLDAGTLAVLDNERHVDVPLYWQQWSIESATLKRVAAALEKAAATSLR
jgi:LysR family transcriptional regulator (chromosome initiation inhibitor)